ncbi:MAG: LysM peptidoglycan-binding domain-containing protein [Puniceicoccaceae bacterium]|nr:MAG: LysM peptidoglycan-binding domain-containing protein [Puniceicoccaceae bacterium]
MLGSSNFGVNPANQTTGAQLEDPPINPRLVPKSYVVKSGDTLSKISKQFYGTENRWNDIYQANRDRLSSARSLRVGQELLIP